MSEIRKHYFLDKYCLIAAERHKRPSDFKLTEKHASSSNCVFCPGNEKKHHHQQQSTTMVRFSVLILKKVIKGGTFAVFQTFILPCRLKNPGMLYYPAILGKAMKDTDIMKL